jgi:hypothetical protein
LTYVSKALNKAYLPKLTVLNLCNLLCNN